MAKRVTTKKHVATLPYLVPPTNEEVDKMEIRWLHQQLLDQMNYDDSEEYRFLAWMMEIEDVEYEARCFDYYDNSLTRRRRRTPQPRSSWDLWLDRLDILSSDPLFDYPELDDHLVNDFDDWPIENHRSCFIIHHDDSSYLYDDFVLDCSPIRDGEPDPETELMMAIPLFGLRYPEKQAVLRAYC